jgi:hypothetical protein
VGNERYPDGKIGTCFQVKLLYVNFLIVDDHNNQNSDVRISCEQRPPRGPALLPRNVIVIHTHNTRADGPPNLILLALKSAIRVLR